MKKSRTAMAMGGFMFLIAVCAIVVAVIILNRSTGDVRIGGEIHYTGLKCMDYENEHVLFSAVGAESWSNVIMANFVDELSTITYQYDGVYSSEAEAMKAEEYAIPEYNIILERDYGEKNNIFSHSFLRDGNKLALTITAESNKVSEKTASYFMLPDTETFPRKLDSMKNAYEKLGFACEIFD